MHMLANTQAEWWGEGGPEQNNSCDVLGFKDTDSCRLLSDFGHFTTLQKINPHYKSGEKTG